MRVRVHLPGCYNSPIYIERLHTAFKDIPDLTGGFYNMVLSDVTKIGCNIIIFSAEEKKMDLDHAD